MPAKNFRTVLFDISIATRFIWAADEQIFNVFIKSEDLFVILIIQ